MVPRPVSWAYRRLGRYYPAVFLTVELQSAFLVAAGTLAVFSFYYESVASKYLIIFAITMGLSALAIGYVLFRSLPLTRPIQRWIGGERDPESTGEAWGAAVSLPLDLVKRYVAIPILVVNVPVAVVSVLILDLSWFAGIPFFIGGLLSIGYATMLHYLAVEVGMRPVILDISATMQSPPKLRRPMLSLRSRLLATLPLINVITGMIVAAFTSDGGGAAELGVNVLIALAVAFTVSFELTVLFTRSILRPIEDLEAATERIRQGRFDAHVPVTTADEIGELSTAWNQMIDGLSERERLREAFGTYLDEEVARYIISEGYDPDGAEVEVSILFCDVTDFTRTAATADATEVVRRLNELFEAVVPIISRHRGHVDQFIGDGLMAVFGAPERMEDHADRAVQCGVEIARTINSRRPGRLRGRRRGQLRDGRRRGDRRRRAALLQRDRRPRQPRGAGRGPHAGDRRPGADHREHARAALGDDGGPAARDPGAQGVRARLRPLRADRAARRRTGFGRRGLRRDHWSSGRARSRQGGGG